MSDQAAAAAEQEEFDRRVNEAVSRAVAAELARQGGQPAGQISEDERARILEQADKIGTRGYDGPQYSAIARAHADPGNPRLPYKGPGAITHTEPVIGEGAGGPGPEGDAVERLVRLLTELGYHQNTIANGENRARVLDNTVMGDVRRFMHDYGIEPDSAAFEGRERPAHELAGNFVDPNIWQGLYDAVNKQRAEQG